MDLSLIFNDFETYYEMRLGKKPKLVRKLRDDDDRDQRLNKIVTKQETSKRSGLKPPNGKDSKISNNSGKFPQIGTSTPVTDDEEATGLEIQGSSMQQQKYSTPTDDVDRIENRYILHIIGDQHDHYRHIS